MSHAIDFGELKQRVSIERAAEMLGAKLTKSGAQRRGPCPLCKAGGDRGFVVTPAKGLYYGFGACGKGGDPRRASAESAVLPHGGQIFRSREAVKGAPIARSEERAFFERPMGAPRGRASPLDSLSASEKEASMRSTARRVGGGPTRPLAEAARIKCI
jgi:hypothetical protein